jgi:hypothetical protein
MSIKPKIKRPLKFKLDAYRFYAVDKLTPMEAFKKAGETHNVSLSGCMTTKAYASGYMSDDIKNFIKRKIAADDGEI